MSHRVTGIIVMLSGEDNNNRAPAAKTRSRGLPPPRYRAVHAGRLSKTFTRRVVYDAHIL